MTFLNFLISGISLGSIYAIIALGYTMVYGIAKMLNFAHGDVIMIGAYVCFYAISRFELPPLISILLAMARLYSPGGRDRAPGLQTSAHRPFPGGLDHRHPA